MVHDQTPVDEVTLEPHVPFQLTVTLEDTVGDIKAKILEHKNMSISDAAMDGLELVYHGNLLTDDHMNLNTVYHASMHNVTRQKFHWSYPYAGIVWITPHLVNPSNDAIHKYKSSSANVIRRSQGDICAAYYDRVETEAERLAGSKKQDFSSYNQ